MNPRLEQEVANPEKELSAIQSPRYPSLYQINTRVWLTALSRTLDWRLRRQTV